MDLSLVDVIIGTAAVVGIGIAFTVWRFRANPPHEHATTELLKRFFDGKVCTICKQPIPPVHRTGSKPGLLNPQTHETYSWDEIPDANLSTALESLQPLCFSCEVAESFRRHYPERVTDRFESGQEAHSDRPAVAD